MVDIDMNKVLIAGMVAVLISFGSFLHTMFGVVNGVNQTELVRQKNICEEKYKTTCTFIVIPK